MTTITPPPPQPPLPPQPVAPPTPPSGGGSQASKVIAILAIVFGVIVVIATATGAIVTSVVSAGTQTVTRTLDVDGIDELDLDVSAGTVRVEFGDVPEATLEVTGGWGTERWTFAREGDELIVATPDRPFGIGWILGGSGRATLTLPQELEDTALDAQITLSAGELDASGTYSELELDVSAGTVEVTGQARELSVDLSAGRAELELADVAEADLSVSAGTLISRLSGEAPDLVNLNVAAGSLTLTLPDEIYDVSVEVSAGGMDNELQTSTSADRRIVGEVSAGQVTLRPRG